MATRVLDRLGLAPPMTIGDIAQLVETLGCRVPRGTTAKLQDVQNGERPRGEDPAVVAEGWLSDPRTAWTCWAVSTLAAALVQTGTLRGDVLGVRRTDDRSPAVDIHSVVAISDGDRRWICDPHFGVGPIPIEGGTFARPGVQAALTPSIDGRFEWTADVPSIPAQLSYRSLTGPLDGADVAMFCDVSVVHSGVSSRPSAMLLLVDGLASLRAESWTDPPELRLWRGSAIKAEEFEVRHYESWDAGADALLSASATTTTVAAHDDAAAATKDG